jgi:isochorismate pyruvate lyase
MRKAASEIETVAEMRACIDAVDGALMALLAERWSFTERAAELKQREGLAAAAPSRVSAVLENVSSRAEAAGLPGEMVAAMWKIMIDEIIAREERVLGKDGVDG